MAKSAFTYDSNGNLRTDTRNTANASSTITRTFTYNTNGTLATATDFSNLSSHTTSYGYGTNSCNAFHDSITLPTVNLSFSVCCVGLHQGAYCHAASKTALWTLSLGRLPSDGWSAPTCGIINARHEGPLREWQEGQPSNKQQC